MKIDISYLSFADKNISLYSLQNMDQREMEECIPEIEFRVRFKHERQKWIASSVNTLKNLLSIGVTSNALIFL
jgi:hypothetical protein